MKFIKISFIAVVLSISTTNFAQNNGNWGLGITLGDPTGFTAKYNMNKGHSLNFNLGSSYFGEIRVGLDYLWHFKPFNTQYVGMHAGFGGVIGFGDSRSIIFKDKDDDFFVRDNEIGIAVRGIVGVDFYPADSPFEIFFEMGPLIGFVPAGGTAVDAALGFRFYP